MNKKAGMKKFKMTVLLCLLFVSMISMGAAAADTKTNGKASLKLTKSEITMIQGKTYTLKASAKNLTQKLSWKSSKKTIATVKATGQRTAKVTAKKAGTAVITVSSGGLRKKCTVRVLALKLNKTSITMDKGKTASLTVRGLPNGQKVVWKSSKPSVISVNSSGQLTAKKSGTAVITAGIGVNTLKCTVKVSSSRWNSLLDKYRTSTTVNQILFIKYQGGSDATAVLYNKSEGVWEKVLSCGAYVGKNGINKAKEGDQKTPTGEFNLTSAFGIKEDPGAKMDYVKVNRNLYWCGDKKYYNQLIDVTKQPHDCHGEHLIDYGPYYDYGMFLDYNKNCTYKKGSAIFLHCKGGKAYTGGCIAVSKNNMIRMIQTMEPGAKICIYPE